MRGTTERSAQVEYELLSTEAGRSLLEEVAAVIVPGPADLKRWRRAASPEGVSAALRLVDGRRRGASKFSRADRMWFEPTALQQSTAEAVARHKAARFEGYDVADLCCGLGGDSLALAGTARRVVAVDRDGGMLRRAVWNARAYEVADRLIAVRALAEAFPIRGGCLVHVDPDRRAAGGPRVRSVADYAPGLAFLKGLAGRCGGGAIKLGPASDYAVEFGDAGEEVEVVSLDGECKEATVWFGDLAGCRRRATALPSGATWTDRDSPGGATSVAEVGEWVHEPDPALIRSGLLDGFARAHGRHRFAIGVDLLWGADRLDSGLVANFLVVKALPLDLKRVRAAMRLANLDAREVKTRGLADASPDQVRRSLRTPGGEPVTVFLLKGRDGGLAVLARRAPS